MVFPAYPSLETTINQHAKTRIQRQISRKTNEMERIRQKIVILQKELSDNDSHVANLRTLIYCRARKNNGIFCEVHRLLERFRGKKHLAPRSSFCATGIVCLTSYAAVVDFGEPAEVIKIKKRTHGSASAQKPYETPRLATSYTSSVASLSISMQVCLETIESESLRFFNRSTEDTDDPVSAAKGLNRKVTKSIVASTIACTPTRSQWPFLCTSPMDRSSPWSPVESSRSMDVSAIDLGPSASWSPGVVPSPRSFCISHSKKPNKRRESRFLEEHRLISFDDDFLSATTDDSSILRVGSRRRSRGESQSPLSVKVQSTENSQLLQDEYFRTIEANDVVGVKALLDVGITIECRNAQSNTGLIVATMNGFWEIVCVLTAWAAGHVNCSNDDGFTALQYAAKLGDQEIVKCLLNCRADVNSKNKFHQTPVMLAARHGHSRVTEMLLGDSALIEKRDRAGRNALMMAARNGRVEVIEVLLKANASLNVVDRRGKTALILLAEHACPRSIKGMELLLDSGAHARADDDDGECALTYLGKRVKQGSLPLDSTVRSIAERMKRSMQ